MMGTRTAHLQATATATAVCCTCFGFRMRNRDIPERRLLLPNDEPDGLHKVQNENVLRHNQLCNHAHENDNQDSIGQGDIDLMFFDAVENHLEEDDYPVNTTSHCTKSRMVTMSDPDSMLSDANECQTSLFEDALSNPTEGERTEDDGRVGATGGLVESQLMLRPPIPTSTSGNDSFMRTRSSGRTSSRRVPGLSIFFARPTFSDRGYIEVPCMNLRQRGYPGQLTEEELAQCILFYREIHKRKGNLLDIVHSLKGIEEEPYAICRFMRDAKFDAERMLERLENNQDLWEDAKAHDFYRDIDTALGVPLVLFLQHYTYFYHGNAKNGCPVNYFKAGKLETEALLAMVSTEASTRYFWHIFYYTFRERMVIAKDRNPDFRRCESINVVDLKGLSSNQLTSEAVECLRGVAKIAEFFPETLHCMVIMNAPTWFVMAWKIIKGFIDQRTARKIEVYSSPEKGRHRLAELVEQSEIPSDFGGTGPALDDSIREHCRKPGDNRDFYSTLVHVKSTEMKKAEMLYVLKAGETARVRVYTRSTTAALASVTCQGKLIGQTKKIFRPTPNVYTPIVGEEKPTPFLTEVHEGIHGPGKLAIEIKGMADTEPNRKLPHGNFLIAVEVKKVLQTQS